MNERQKIIAFIRDVARGLRQAAHERELVAQYFEFLADPHPAR